jgi:hypothetical protein
MLLLVEGEQGSGKSFICEVAKRLIDPNAIEKLRLPKKEQDLMIQAAENALLVYDNASAMKWDISDALCALATGSGFSVRKLYTDAESSIFKNCRPVIINGIGEFAHRPDLLERSILLQLPSMPIKLRKTERVLKQEFERILPKVLGCLYDIIAAALRNQGTVSVAESIRMADAAEWIAAAEPATGLEPGTMLPALIETQDEMMVEKAIHAPLVAEILELIPVDTDTREVGELRTTVGDLHHSIAIHFDRGPPRWFPPTPAHLSTEIKRLAPALLKIGVHVEFGKRTRKGRPIIISVDGEIPLSIADKINFKY